MPTLKNKMGFPVSVPEVGVYRLRQPTVDLFGVEYNTIVLLTKVTVNDINRGRFTIELLAPSGRKHTIETNITRFQTCFLAQKAWEQQQKQLETFDRVFGMMDD